MKPMRLMVLMGLAAFLPAGTLWGQPAAVQEQVAALTQTLQKDEARLKQYEWIETTSVNVKGKMVSRTQKRCVWGEDGKLQKVLITPSPEAKKRRGLAAWIAEKRKKELKDYIKSVVEMLKTYVPPDPASLQAAQDAGKVSLHVTRPGARVRLKFRDYHRAGDRLGVETDLIDHHILSMMVSTYLAGPKDPVTLNVSFATLRDGMGYPAQAILEAKTRKTQVTVENSDLRPMEPARQLPGPPPANPGRQP